MRVMVLKHKWSFVSGITTLVHCAVIYGVVDYLYQRNRWHPDTNPTAPIVRILELIHITTIIVAVGTAIGGISAERPRIYAVVALVFALASFLIFVE